MLDSNHTWRLAASGVLRLPLGYVIMSLVYVMGCKSEHCEHLPVTQMVAVTETEQEMA